MLYSVETTLQMQYMEMFGITVLCGAVVLGLA